MTQKAALSDSSPRVTPMMQQWHQLKEQAQNAFLLFRLGDFYEAFHEDAEQLSILLDLTLTKRQEVPMCGIPWHSSESYIEKLLSLGYTVALAEQTPGANEKLMERKIIRMISPSTSLSPTITPPEKHSLFISISHHANIWAASLIDVTCSLFEGFIEPDERFFLQEIAKRNPKEILLSSNFLTTHSHFVEEIQKTTHASISKAPAWMFERNAAEEALKLHFKVHSLDGLGLTEHPSLIQAMGAHITYLKNTLLFPIDSYTTFNLHQRSSFMNIDRSTIENLEIFESHSSLKGAKSLYDILNHCSTPMGSRLLRTYLLLPLIDELALTRRQNNVAAFLEFLHTSPLASKEAETLLQSIKDIERTMLRIYTGSFSPRDVLALGLSLHHIEPLKQILHTVSNTTASSFIQLPSLCALKEKILSTLQDPLPLRITDGNIIRSTISSELDELRSIKQNATAWLLQYQAKLREELDIRTLKVGFTRAFGYYIEVSRSLSEKMPPSFIRRQTLTGQERFISEELKLFEDKILSAESKITALESTLFSTLVQEITSHQPLILHYAKAIAEVDLFFTFARQALAKNYVRPTITNDTTLVIQQGRHPVIEASPFCPHFTPNDLSLDAKGPSLLLITGPNMGGKSTYIRQAALLVIMAHIGSWIPAEAALIGIVDKVFSRVGASDDLARGQSTFMVEMTETAHILRSASPRSFILFDEIGRGTSTFDGISIAQAVAEHVLSSDTLNPRTLFATHYFELTSLEERFKNKIKNMTVHVSDSADGLQFFHLVVEGKADKSYGIHVARLAGMPEKVISRAKEILSQFETQKQQGFSTYSTYLFPIKETAEQPHTEWKECHQFLKKMDLTKLTPIECFMKLIKFKDTLKI